MRLEIDTSPPTPDKINAVIEDLIATEVAGVPDPNDFRDFWECLAYDPTGELEGVGYGLTPAEAKAAAWVTACGWLVTIKTRHLRAIPRTVPTGWTFQVYPPGNRANWCT